jgi:hypothetical protein
VSENLNYHPDNVRKPILCLDFDGVIHSYTSGWHGVDIIADPPVDHAFEMIAKYMEDFEVCVVTSRLSRDNLKDVNPSNVPMAEEQIKGVMHTWFRQHGMSEGVLSKLELRGDKPAGFFLLLDDRALQFKGTFPRPHLLQKFVPWYQEGEP